MTKKHKLIIKKQFVILLSKILTALLWSQRFKNNMMLSKLTIGKCLCVYISLEITKLKQFDFLVSIVVIYEKQYVIYFNDFLT